MGEEKDMRKILFLLLVVTVSLSLAAPCLAGTETLRVDKETLKSWLDDPRVLIIDVRAGNSWVQSKKKIQGAIRKDPQNVGNWAPTLPTDKKIVLY